MTTELQEEETVASGAQGLAGLELRGHQPAERLSSFPGATADQQVHPAVVWRLSGGLDDLHVVLPDAVVLRLRAGPLASARASPINDLIV